MLGGFLLLIVMWAVEKITGSPLVTRGQLEILTYHGLGLGFAAYFLPIMLLMGYISKSTSAAVIGMLICTVLFIIYNIILFHRFIFKKKAKSEA